MRPHDLQFAPQVDADAAVGDYQAPETVTDVTRRVIAWGRFGVLD